MAMANQRDDLMNTTLPTRRGLVAGLAAGALIAYSRPLRAQDLPKIVVSKEPSCGCCTGWVDHEEVIGTHVHVFGNVVVAVAACEITENDAEVNRGVEMLLLVRDEGQWRIVSQAWDTENPSKPIPAFLTACRSKAGEQEPDADP